MIAVAVLAVLAAIAIPNLISYRNTSHATACRENMDLIERACQASLLRTGTVETDLNKLCDATSTLSFLKGKPKCPIGGSYSITYDLAHEVFVIKCSKADDVDHNVEE